MSRRALKTGHYPNARFTASGSRSMTARVKATAGSGGFKFKTIPAGAATSVWAATSPELEGKGGLYLEDCHIGELKTEPTASSGYFAYAIDPASAARLWAVSEQTLGQKVDLGQRFPRPRRNPCNPAQKPADPRETLSIGRHPR